MSSTTATPDPLSGLVVALADALEPRLLARVEEAIERHVSPQSPYLTVEQAADYLRTTPHAIRSMIQRGELPALRPSRRLLLEKTALDLWARGE